MIFKITQVLARFFFSIGLLCTIFFFWIFSVRDPPPPPPKYLMVRPLEVRTCKKQKLWHKYITKHASFTGFVAVFEILESL